MWTNATEAGHGTKEKSWEVKPVPDEIDQWADRYARAAFLGQRIAREKEEKRMRDLIAAFVVASAAGQGTDAQVLDAVHKHLGISTFGQLRTIIERICAAEFGQCVPWPTSTAHFESVADEVRYVSCAGTVVRLTADGSFAIESRDGDSMGEEYYRVEAARPYVVQHVANI